MYLAKSPPKEKLSAFKRVVCHIYTLTAVNTMHLDTLSITLLRCG